jgi:hypothetical protein
MDHPGFEFHRGESLFLHKSVQAMCVRSSQPCIQWVLGILAVESLGREADHTSI